jgi:hypothetical protein
VTGRTVRTSISLAASELNRVRLNRFFPPPLPSSRRVAVRMATDRSGVEGRLGVIGVHSSAY